MQGYQFKGSGLKDGFSFDGRSGSCDYVLDGFNMCGGQVGMGFQNLGSGMLVRQLRVAIPCSGL